MLRVPRLALLLIAVVGAALARPGATAQVAGPVIPGALTNEEFWRLSEELSEPPGYFRSENLVSNEHTYQYVIPDLQAVARGDGVYLGVAPDQNFTYIIATRPRMAFIVDVRRGNLIQHLMYKAVFELSPDRAEFVSKLFSKPKPGGLRANATVVEIFSAFARVETSEVLYRANLRAITEHLTRRRGIKLSTADLEQLEAIYFAFFWQGPSLRYSTIASGFGGRRGGGGFPTYEEMIEQTDWDGRHQSYLASETNYRFVRRLQERNLIVPVTGNFAGPKALRAVARYVRERQSVVSAFYVSNVEQYLFQDGLFDDFARNVSTFPVDQRSTFIRSVSIRYGYGGSRTWTDGRASALYPIAEFIRDYRLGLLRTYYDVNSRSR